MSVENVIETDVLVIGGGMAGVFAAIKASGEGVNVTLVDKTYVGKSGGVFHSEGFFSVFNPAWGHNLKDWMAQIAKTGEYINNPEWTEVTLKESYDRYKDLVSWGIKFQKGEDGEPLRRRRGAIEACLIGMGWTWFPTLRKAVLNSGAKIMDRIMVTDLLKQDGKVVGAVGFHTRSGDFYIFKAKATIVCTRGGDGEVMAYRAGAEISGKEFIIGAGAYKYAGLGLYGEKGDDAKVSYKDKNIKPIPSWDGGARHYIDRYLDVEGNKINRYTVGWAVHEGRGPILWNLDAASPQELSDIIHEIKQGGTGFKLERSGLDLSKGGLYSGAARFEFYSGSPVFAGGSGICSTDLKGGTTLAGLYSAGDTYNTRAIGARYPFWGFALRNASVTGTRAGQAAAEYSKHVGEIQVDSAQINTLKNYVYAPLERLGGFDKDWVRMQLTSIMVPYYVWMVKHGDRLKAALTNVEFFKNHVAPLMYVKSRDSHELGIVLQTKNRILSIEMSLRAGIFRTESRASHYREDYPRRDDLNWLAAVKIKEKDGSMELTKEPFPKEWGPDPSIPYKERYPMEFPGEE